MKINIPEYVRKILDILENGGYSAYIVGGCVRDSLMGKPPHDYDVCTDCTPERTVKLFSDFHTIETGLKHGTVTVMSEGEPIEITTFRSDGKYLDHRRPQSVKFEKELSEDLKRRDFTVNAMCYNEREGLIDLFGGAEDLKNGVVKCVGDPFERFDEDALRIMRALRFSSVLGFEIEKNTSYAMRKLSGLLNSISAERIFTELKKLLRGEYAEKILLEYKDIMGVIIPELIPTFDCEQNCPHHIYNVYGHICKSVTCIEPDEELRLTMLLHDIEKPSLKKTDEYGVDHFKKHQFASAETAGKILRRMKCSNKTEERIVNLITEHDNRIPLQKKSVRRLISKYDFDFFRDWLSVRRADTMAQSEYLRQEKLRVLNELEKLGAEIEENESCLKISDLAVNGNDMIEMGYSGKAIGKALEFALDGVIDELVANDRQEITDYIRRYYNEKA